MNHRIALSLSVVLLVALLVTGCAPIVATPSPAAEELVSPEPTAVGPRRGGVVTRAITSEPRSLDPHGPPSAGANLMLPYLYDSLVYRAPDNTFHPYLAESWKVAPDGLTITMTLRSGVTFHDGSPLNAEAVVFTFERLKAQGRRSPIYGGVRAISAVEAVDDLTVRFRFERPYAMFFTTISQPYAGILSPSAVEAAGDAYGQHPVGTGPFKLASWEPGVQVTLVPNPDYAWPPPDVENPGPPYIDEFVFKVIPESTTQIAALQAGEVDILFVNDPAHIAMLEEDPNIRLERATLFELVYLGFNCRKPPFDDPLVRRALSHAINKAEIIEIALDGRGTPAFAPLPPGLPGFDPALQEYEYGYDLEQAEALLQEAGFVRSEDGTWTRDGEPLTAVLLTSTRAPNEAVATVIQSQLKALGIPVEIQQLESAAVRKRTAEGDFDLLLWRYGWTDADALNIAFSSSRIGSTNRVGYSNPEVDALLEQGLREMDPEARERIYIKAQKIIMREAPWQPLYVPEAYIAFGPRIRGAKVVSMGRVLMNDVYVVEE
ncbi:MAG TPA: ABC transporter substrate-binding protein [Caldilineae bacterium]|nr:ABC transporter substrate-binding protein [Caldilineae bacterium]